MSCQKKLAVSFFTGSIVGHGSLQAFILFIDFDFRLFIGGRGLVCLGRIFKVYNLGFRFLIFI